MPETRQPVTESRRITRLSHFVEAVRRAFAEFLTIPSLIIIGFLLLGAGAYHLDGLRIASGWPAIVPGSHDSISTLLGTIATSIITVTSITFSLLLLAVQQGAAALTSQVYDQFLRRRANQAYFGFFIGLALYSLIILATVHPNYTPIYGAIIAFVLTVIALYLLVLLIYSTIDQMRPVMIVQTIRQHTIAARHEQRELLGATRRESSASSLGAVRVAAAESGYLKRIDVAALKKVGRDCLGASEIVVLRSIGDYVSIGEDLVEVRFAVDDPVGIEGDAVRSAVTLEQQRDLAGDPAFGIEQLITIGWTSASTSKSNPQPGILACWNLRDLIATWYDDSARSSHDGAQPSADDFAIVYHDNVPGELVRALESLAVVASESMQHQTLAEVYRALELGIRRFPDALRAQTDEVILRSISALGDHVLTTRLDEAIQQLASTLADHRCASTADALRQARSILMESIGVLNSRATRTGPA